MAMDKIHRKLDLIMEKLGIDVSEFKPKPAPAAPKLSAAEQQAIDNAPKPTPVVGPGRGPRVTATNAPDTTSSVPRVPADVEAAKGKGKPGKSERVNWNS